eukprot:g928.t1
MSFHNRRTKTPSKTFWQIPDLYETTEDVYRDLRASGLESSQLIVGIDYTKSNEWNGVDTFGGKSLHSITEGEQNLYEWALTAIAATLSKFDDDDLIPCYGFGDVTTKEVGVFSFFPDNRPADGLDGALKRYRQITPHVKLSGPTNFAPLIHQAIRTVKESRHDGPSKKMDYHILLILADGQVTEGYLKETQDAIVSASYFPLSIVMIGIGDGPWDQMEAFDDKCFNRRFDNFQFVNLAFIMKQASAYGKDMQRQYAHFALHALMEIPHQYQYIVNENLMSLENKWYSLKENVLFDVPKRVKEADATRTGTI